MIALFDLRITCVCIGDHLYMDKNVILFLKNIILQYCTHSVLFCESSIAGICFEHFSTIQVQLSRRMVKKADNITIYMRNQHKLIRRDLRQDRKQRPMVLT